MILSSQRRRKSYGYSVSMLGTLGEDLGLLFLQGRGDIPPWKLQSFRTAPRDPYIYLAFIASCLKVCIMYCLSDIAMDSWTKNRRGLGPEAS